MCKLCPSRPLATYWSLMWASIWRREHPSCPSRTKNNRACSKCAMICSTGKQIPHCTPHPLSVLFLKAFHHLWKQYSRSSMPLDWCRRWAKRPNTCHHSSTHRSSTDHQWTCNTRSTSDCRRTNRHKCLMRSNVHTHCSHTTATSWCRRWRRPPTWSSKC